MQKSTVQKWPLAAANDLSILTFAVAEQIKGRQETKIEEWCEQTQRGQGVGRPRKKNRRPHSRDTPTLTDGKYILSFTRTDGLSDALHVPLLK
jgi:hypothetical protein